VPRPLCRRILNKVGGGHEAYYPHACRDRVLLKPSEAAEFLRLSLSWLAKRRASGDGPPFVRMGRAIRYSQSALLLWTKSRQQLSNCDRYTTDTCPNASSKIAKRF